MHHPIRDRHNTAHFYRNSKRQACSLLPLSLLNLLFFLSVVVLETPASTRKFQNILDFTLDYCTLKRTTRAGLHETGDCLQEEHKERAAEDKQANHDYNQSFNCRHKKVSNISAYEARSLSYMIIFFLPTR
jgi:hypothetical protein